MNKINIGTEVNLTDLIQSRMLIQANSGGGKSVLARALMEKAYGKVPFITFDQNGEYYTLKEHYPDVVVIGGPFPDLVLSLKSAVLLPQPIIQDGLSVVIDLSDLKSHQKQRYVKEFLEALMDLPQTHWTPYLIFIEEAHFFCGQQDKKPTGVAVRELMAGGRKKGYCGILITRHISKLHKDAAAEVNNKFVGRTHLDADMNRAAQELGFATEEKRLELRDLKPGEFYVYGTSVQPHYVHKVKVKLPRTKPPKAGVATEIKARKPTAKILSALQKLNALPKEAEAEKKTIATKQPEVNRSKAEVNQRKTVQVEKTTGQSLEKARLRIEELTQQNEEWRQRHDALKAEIDRLGRENESIRRLLTAIQKQMTYTADLIVKTTHEEELSAPKKAVHLNSRPEISTPKAVPPREHRQ